MVEQQRTTAADQSLAKKQIELDVVEQQIKKIDAWRERAAVSLFLERIRDEYEQHRQPETLREASKYMTQLTSGKYTRIWTPLAHDILFVDTPEGQSLPVQVLSRGTREQLFVSLRLALVSAYARRGIHLPMILDDVFVNYDAGRTRTASRCCANSPSRDISCWCSPATSTCGGCSRTLKSIRGGFRIGTTAMKNSKSQSLRRNRWPCFRTTRAGADSGSEAEGRQAAEVGTCRGGGRRGAGRSGRGVEEIVDSEPAELVIEYDPKPAPPTPMPPAPAEVEYWWDSRQPHAAEHTNGHNGKAAPIRSSRPWPASPMIHRPDWW